MKDLTIKELKEALTQAHEDEREAKVRVNAILTEILNRRRDSLDDGYWTDYGFVK